MALNMDPERRRRMIALAEWHREWVERHEDEVEFHPEDHPDKPDYPEHHIDLDASGAAWDEFDARAAEILGLDRQTDPPPADRGESGSGHRQ